MQGRLAPSDNDARSPPGTPLFESALKLLFGFGGQPLAFVALYAKVAVVVAAETDFQVDPFAHDDAPAHSRAPLLTEGLIQSKLL